MCMNIIAWQCLPISIAFCSRAFVVFPSFTLSSSSLFAPFFPSFPSYMFPLLPFLFVSLPPFFSTLPFPIRPFLPPLRSSNPFSPPPLLSFLSLLFLLASFPSNLFFSYSSINRTLPFF